MDKKTILQILHAGDTRPHVYAWSGEPETKYSSLAAAVILLFMIVLLLSTALAFQIGG